MEGVIACRCLKACWRPDAGRNQLVTTTLRAVWCYFGTMAVVIQFLASTSLFMAKGIFKLLDIALHYVTPVLFIIH